MKFVPKGPRRYAHQRRILRRIIETKGVCALLCEPGTGKTAPTLDYLSILALKSPTVVNGDREIRALVISPKAAVDNWVIQAEKYVHDGVNVWAEALGGSILQKAEAIRSRGPEYYRPRRIARKKDAAQLPHRGLNADRAELIYARGAKGPARGPADLKDKPRLILLSLNYDTFASRASRGSTTMADVLMEAVKRFKPDVIVCDEMHKLKGPGSNTSRLVSRVGNLSRRRIGLTGTVMPHSPMDVFAQWRFLQPTAFGAYDPRTGQRKRATFGEFQRRFGVMGGFMGREVVRYINLDEMQAIMADNSIVVKKEDALDLPQAVDVVIPVVLSSKEQRIYNEMKSDLAATLGDKQGQTSVPNRLTQMLRLRQITAGHLPNDDGEVQIIGDSKVSTIASIAHDTLEGEKRIVVFAVFRHEIEELRRVLSKPGTEVLVIDGTTPDSERLRLRKRFGDTANHPERIILVAQIKTISLSVNELVTASNAIFASLSQQRDDLIQARDRLNRIGQKRKMTFWFPLARGTVDEVIYKSHEDRTNLEAAVLKHVQGITELPEAEFTP